MLKRTMSEPQALLPGQPNPCELKDKCGWDGKSVGCTRAGCFGPAIFRLEGKVG